MTQKSGTAEMSVDMCVVTPSMRLHGTAAQRIQRMRRAGVTSSVREMEGTPAPGVAGLAGAEGGAVTDDAAAMVSGLVIALVTGGRLSRCLPFFCLLPF